MKRKHQNNQLCLCLEILVKNIFLQEDNISDRCNVVKFFEFIVEPQKTPNTSRTNEILEISSSRNHYDQGVHQVSKYQYKTYSWICDVSSAENSLSLKIKTDAI